MHIHDAGRTVDVNVASASHEATGGFKFLGTVCALRRALLDDKHGFTRRAHTCARRALGPVVNMGTY